jgi:membrane associated rhomboid family serine protease
MVMPLSDDNSDRLTTPFVNYAFIAVNLLVFVFLQGIGENQQFTFAFSTVPREIATGKDIETPPRELQHPVTGQTIEIPGLQRTPGSVYVTLLTSMFMHGGWAHLLGNMLFLWIFGDNVEDRLGHFRYLVYYLVCGVLASLAHVALTVGLNGVNSEAALIPSLGASGAISGVLGGYLVLYPRRQVLVLLFRFLTYVPAYVAIGIWFAFQLISGLGTLGPGSKIGGVAYAAHVGGFVAGVALIWPFAMGRPDNQLRQPTFPPRFGRRGY